MKLLRWLFLLLCAAATPARAAGPATAGEFTVDGVRVIVQPRPASETVTAGIFVRGGRQNQTAANAGIEALLFAAAIEGTERFPRDALRAEVARTAAVLDYKCFDDYSVLSVRCTVDVLPRALALAADALLHPALAPEDVERVRTRLVALAASDTDLDRVRRREADVWLLRGHPYAAPTEGTPETLRAITLADLRAHHARVLARGRMLVVVAGGVDVAQVQPLLQGVFAAVPAGDPPPPAAPALQFSAPGSRTARFASSVPRADVLFAAPAADAPDFPALQLAAAILRTRLFEVLRDRASLAYDPTVDLEVQAAPRGAIRFSTADPDAAARLVAEQVDRLRREAVPATLAAAVARAQRATDLTAAQTNDAQVAWLAEFELVRGGWRHAAEDPYSAVTPEAIRAAAQRYLANLQFLVLGPPGTRVDGRIFAR